MAEGILKKKIAEHQISGNVESAGFESFHINDPPDPRAVQTAESHGIDISRKRARLFRKEDFDRFDRIFVMDLKNYRDIMFFARNEEDKAKVEFIMNVLKPGKNEAVPDPYYRALEACEEVYSLLDAATDKILEDLLKEKKA